VKYTVRPISDRTWLRPASARRRSQFDSTWSATVALLNREIKALDGRNVAIEADVSERDIRNDGMLRANARPETPAVVVAFETEKHGALLYRCDRYITGWRGEGVESWQHNVRAIALTLDALRAVDRYGATETGQQYAGFKALPAGRAMPASTMDADEAWSIIGSYQPRPIAQLRNDHTAAELAAAYKRARIANHPDKRDGDHELWHQVSEAARVLGVTA
jgi:hypothetical protein